MDQDELALLKMGLKVGSQKEQFIKIIRSTSNLREEFEKLKANLKTMTNEDQYLETITSSHQNITDIAENSKVIILRDNTFQIRAINPDDIESLTERAFFNSFNLQRNVLNDLEGQNNINQSQKADSQKDQIPEERQEDFVNKAQTGDEGNCICGKVIPGCHWIQCINQDKCRGASWYHLECAGIDQKDLQNITQKQFICEQCKRDDEEDSKNHKKVKSN